MNKEDIINKIESFRELKQNWNGYDAEPISEKVIIKAIQLVNELEPTPSVFPTGRNTIQLEWETKELHLYLELEIYEDKIELYNHANYGETNAYIGGE